MIKAALLQLSVTDDPVGNLPRTQTLIRNAAGAGATFVLTPEVTNCVSTSRRHQQAVLQNEDDDFTLAALSQQAKDLGIWLLIGSLAIKTQDPDRRFANRSFLIGPSGEIVARYDKIHMFDVAVSKAETYQESKGYRPGNQAVVAAADFANIGMTVCYDLRFAQLYRDLALAGAHILTVPSAFSPVTGRAHWHSLLRARAIETGCYVLAPAQCGTHTSATSKSRDTYGHSLAVSPWGEVLLDAQDTLGVHMVDIDLAEVERARSRVPSLTHGRDYLAPVISGVAND